MARPIISTSGTVRATVDSAEPRHRLIERCSLLPSAAFIAVMLSGARISAAISVPPTDVGTSKRVNALLDHHRQIFGEPDDRHHGQQQEDGMGGDALPLPIAIRHRVFRLACLSPLSGSWKKPRWRMVCRPRKIA